MWSEMCLHIRSSFRSFRPCFFLSFLPAFLPSFVFASPLPRRCRSSLPAAPSTCDAFMMFAPITSIFFTLAGEIASSLWFVLWRYICGSARIVHPSLSSSFLTSLLLLPALSFLSSFSSSSSSSFLPKWPHGGAIPAAARSASAWASSAV